MGANECAQRLDLAEIFTTSMLKLKIDVKMVNLFTQTRSTCLPWPGLPVYPSLIYLFTQARSTCLPRPGQPVYPGLDFFQDVETPSKTFIFHRFRHLRGLQASGLSPSDPPWKVSMTPSIFSQIHNTATPKVMFEVLGPWKSYLYMGLVGLGWI